MAHVLIMPRQGNTVESCIIVDWKVKEGDTVAADTNVCEVETDKATFEVPAGEAGTVLKLVRSAGDDVPVLSPIAVIGKPGEDWEAAVGGAGEPSAAPVRFSEPQPPAKANEAPAATSFAAAAGSDAVGSGRAASPRARNLAAKEAVDLSALAGSGPGGRVIERDVRAAMEGRPALTASAKAALATGDGSVPAIGSGFGGRATVGDLKSGPVSAAAPASPAVAARTVASVTDFPGPVTETPVKGIRKLIADRMRSSLESSAQLTFNGSANAKQIQALRARFKADGGAFGLSGVTIGDLVVYAVTRVLPLFPYANATLENGTLKTYERVHLALAVDTPRGLMVPVIRNADQLSLSELSSESKRLAAACQAGSISPDELSGGTFTVSNLGAFGVESFTPVLNAPQVAILGVDNIVPRAAAGPDGALVLEQRLGLSLTVDHQVIDGAPAARLLKGIADAITDIDLWLAK